MSWPHDNEAELDAFYTRPDGSAAWEVKNLTYIHPPWKCYLAGTSVELVHGIRVHVRVADSLHRIFDALWETFGKSQAEIEKVDLHQIGGAYYFRARRGSKRLSNHARGIAIDIDPQDNRMATGNRGDMDMRIVKAFEVEGWRWGYHFSDPMHFEAVFNNYAALSKPEPREKPFDVAYKIASKELAEIERIAKEKTPSAYVRSKINDATLALVKRFEAFRATQYSDVGFPAIGYGRRDGFRGFRITPGMVVTEDIASAWLKDDLEHVGDQIRPHITAQLNDNQFGALCSFTYNLGLANFAKSTLLKQLNVGDFPDIKNQLMRWNRSGGKVLAGLTKRRAAEAALFNTP